MSELRCDVAVVGGGPAGIAAAVSAAEAGAAVTLIDEAPRPGGQIWRHVDEQQLPSAARTWLQRLRQAPVTLLNGASVFDAAAPASTIAAGQSVDPSSVDASRCELHIEQHGAAMRVRAQHVVLACGARELFLPFPGWTLPGVVGVGGAQALLKAGYDMAGQRVLIAGTGPLLFPVAAALSRAGADVIEVLEQAPREKVIGFGATLWRTPRRIAEAASYRRSFARTPYCTGTWVVRVEGSTGMERAVISDGARSHTRTIECDMLCIGYGLVPATELARHLGCLLRADGSVHVDSRQRTSVTRVLAVGETTGVAGVDAAIIEGRIAGLEAAGARPPRSLLRRAAAKARFVRALARAFAPRDEIRHLALADTIVCRCEDVTWQQVRRCASIREAKLLTRAGMGPCQGRICGAAIECMTGWQPDRVRAPVMPATVDAMRET